MNLVTLKKFLTTEGSSRRQILSFLLKELTGGAVRAAESDYVSLKDDLERIEAGLHEDSSAEQFSSALKHALETVGLYNQRVSIFIRRQNTELQKVIAMLAKTVITIAGSSERAAHALDELQINLRQASGLEDLQTVKMRLGECLQQVCEESARRREESEKITAELQNQMREAANTSGPHDGDLDRVTGLPGRIAAEAALQEALEQPGRKYLAVVVLDRLRTVNSRFGNAVGDRVFAELAQHVKNNLTPADRLFRWSGPALVALLPRQCTIDRARLELKPLLGKPLEREMRIGERSVLIPISAAWSVLGLFPPLTQILKQLDGFVADQVPKDYL